MPLDRSHSEILHLSGSVPIPENYPDVGAIALDPKCLYLDSEGEERAPLVNIENRVSPTIMIRTYVRLEDVSAIQIYARDSDGNGCSDSSAEDKPATTLGKSHDCPSDECKKLVYGRNSIMAALKTPRLRGIVYVNEGAKMVRHEINGVIAGRMDVNPPDPATSSKPCSAVGCAPPTFPGGSHL